MKLLIIISSFFIFISSLQHFNEVNNEILDFLRKQNSYKKIKNELISSEKDNDDDLIDISSGYTRIKPGDSTYFYIPIFATSDIHGHFYPEEIESGKTNYTRGGLDYISKYVNILREEFPNRVIYLDAGDQFRGGTESLITDGEIITDYFNALEANGSTIGNHEYYYTREFLEKKISEAKFPYLTTNVYDTKKETKKAFGDNHLTSKIFTVIGKGDTEIKIGVVGLSKNMSPDSISGNGFDDIIFLDYKEELVNEANILRTEKGADAVILLAHIGLKCGEVKTMELNMYSRTSAQDSCETSQELYSLANSLEAGVIDAIIAGHSHSEVHHWVNDIPIVGPIDQGFYSNILYLPFKKDSKTGKYSLFKSKIQIEGPLPSCERIFESLQTCQRVTASQIEKYLPLVEYKFHGVKMEKDSNLEKIHQKYDEEYNIYKEVICKIVGTEYPIATDYSGDDYVGNIITDIENKISGSEIAIIASGQLRTTWNPGSLTKAKILDMLPFENKICTFTMNGDEIFHMMSIIQTGEKAYYSTSGLKQIINKNNKGAKFLSELKLFDGYKEYELKPDEEYLISIIDYYIVGGGDDFSKVLEWYKPRNLNCEHGILSERVESYLKEVKTLDVNKFKDENNPRIKELF